MECHRMVIHNDHVLNFFGHDAGAWVLDFRIVGALPAEAYVVGAKVLTVVEFYPLAELEGIDEAIRARLIAGGELGRQIPFQVMAIEALEYIRKEKIFATARNFVWVGAGDVDPNGSRHLALGLCG